MTATTSTAQWLLRRAATARAALAAAGALHVATCAAAFAHAPTWDVRKQGGWAVGTVAGLMVDAFVGQPAAHALRTHHSRVAAALRGSAVRPAGGDVG
eukprot:gene39819-30552_t